VEAISYFFGWQESLYKDFMRLVRELEHLDSTQRNMNMEILSLFFASVFAGMHPETGFRVEEIHTTFNVSMEQSGKHISHIKMSAARQKKVMRHADHLIDLIFTQQLKSCPGLVHTSEQYKLLFHQHIRVLNVLQDVNDISEAEDIVAVQDILDDFYIHYLDMFGQERVSNYIHTIGSGHCK